jgi:hypothetical protein
MASRITPLAADRITRRRVTIGGVDLVLWLRVNNGRPEMAVDLVGKRHVKLRWRPLANVIAESFAFDVGLLFGQQLELGGASHA